MPASALTDGGCHSDIAWAEERLPAIDVSAEAIPQLDILDQMNRSSRINVSDV